jgi:ubiquinol-cytochrome c reductase subunit 8
MGGKEFGNLIKAKNIITYSLSPFEQRAFAGFISKSGPNVVRRFTGSIGYILPAFISTFLVINWAKNENHRLSRKDPKEFENDE